MNKWIGMGRLTKDPDVRVVKGSDGKDMTIARTTLAVDRRVKSNDQSADFISCVFFGKLGEFADKHLVKGIKVIVAGRIQTGSYTDKDGNKRYTTDVIVEECNFCERKSTAAGQSNQDVSDDFMNIPDGMEEELPFN